ncbi:hypothetical protein [Nostoc sp.]|uniref:hypothetical protein n=1 Tax=Nostoc sp. TaxID=1180 RepID=UPI002FF49FE6
MSTTGYAYAVNGTKNTLLKFINLIFSSYKNIVDTRLRGSELGTSTFELGTSTSELGTSTFELGTSTFELGTSTSELGT